MKNHIGLYAMLMLLCLVSSIATASPFERIHLKDGSTYEGYIMKQVPGKNMTVHVEMEVVNFTDSGNNISVNNRRYKMSELNANWINWADEHPEFIEYVDGEKYMLLSDLSGSGLYCTKVKVLERGRFFVKYISFPNKDKTFDIKDVQTIEKITRSQLTLSGIDEEIELRDSIFVKGQMIFQNLGKDVRVLTKDGIIEILPIDKIAKISKFPLNNKQDIFSQAQYLDVVEFDKRSITGIIIVQNYPQKSKDRYLLLHTANGETIHINNDKVQSIGKVLNDKYVPLQDMIIADNKLYIDSIACDTVQFSKVDDVFVFEKDIKPIMLDGASASKGVKIVMKNTASARKMQMISLSKKEIVIEKKTLFADEVVEKLYGFSYQDIVEAVIAPIDTFDTPSNNLHQVYKLFPGRYAFYDTNNKLCYYIQVK